MNQEKSAQMINDEETVDNAINLIYDFLQHKKYDTHEIAAQKIKYDTIELREVLGKVFPMLEVKIMDFVQTPETMQGCSFISVGNQIITITICPGEDKETGESVVSYIGSFGFLPSKEEIRKTVEIIQEQNINNTVSIYSIGAEIKEIIPKFKELEYDTFARYVELIILGDDGDGSGYTDLDCANVQYIVRYCKPTMVCNEKGKNSVEKINLATDLLSLTLYSNNRLHIEYPTKCCGIEVNEYGTIEIEAEELDIIVEDIGKDYKKKLKSQLEQYFKVAYHNLKSFLDEIEYK